MATGRDSQTEELLVSMHKLRDDMADMQKSLIEDKEASEARLAKHIKLDPLPSFKKKSPKQQFIFNSSLEEKLDSCATALEKSAPDLDKARCSLEEGMKLPKDRQKLIKIADRSEFGWSTVAEYVEDELAENSDDEKRLFRAEGRAKRKHRAYEEKKQKASRKPFGRRDSKMVSSARYSMAGPSTNRFLSPSVGAVATGTGNEIGPCFACGKMGHLRRYCPINKP